MKAVVFYESGDVSTERIMEVYPRHKKLVDKFSEQGRILALGTFANPPGGSMGIFADRESAEDFIGQDPFMKEGIVGKVTLKEWNEILL